MQELEQVKVNKDAQKKSLIGDGVLLFVLVIGIILAVFAWFNTLDRGAKATGVNIISADDIDVRFFTYPGTLNADKTVTYTEDPLLNMNNTDFDEQAHKFSMYPGDVKYFKTIIKNYDQKIYTGTFALQNILVNPKLATDGNTVYVSFASDLGPDTAQQDHELESGSISSESGVSKLFVGTQPVYDNLTLQPAQEVTVDNNTEIRPYEVTVYWYVVLDGENVTNSIFTGEESTTVVQQDGQDVSVPIRINAQMMELNRVRFVLTGG